MSNVAIIPARGGSKRIPGKNIRPFAGKPIIGYSIETALESGLFDRVIVSTDDEEIAEISRKFGAEVPFMRPAELAQDASADIDTFRHYFEWIKVNEGELPEMVVHLRATNPVRRVEIIDQAIELLAAHPDADEYP